MAGSPLRPGRRWRRRTMPLLAVFLVVSAGCSDVPEPAAFEVADVPAASRAGEPVAPSSGETPDVPIESSFVPRAPDGYVPGVAFVSGDSLMLVEGSEAVPVESAGVGVVRAFDDLLGGLVVEHVLPEGGVVWHPSEGAEPVMVAPAPAQLLDVSFTNGEPVARILTEGNRIEWVGLVELDRATVLELDPAQQVVQMSSAGALNAVALADEGCGALEFVTDGGEAVTPIMDPTVECAMPRFPALGGVALSPNGRAAVYTEVEVRDDGVEISTDLVAVDLRSGVVFARRRVGGSGVRVSSLAFDGRRVALARHQPDGSEVVLVDLAIGTTTNEQVVYRVADVNSVRQVTFIRRPLG
ncbi:MAG: hypothetical protein ACK5PP_04295 [Acidimicrobiales bacterium]